MQLMMTDDLHFHATFRLQLSIRFSYHLSDYRVTEF